MNKKAIILVIIAVFIGIYFISAMKNTAPVEVVNAPDWMSITAAQEKAREQEKKILDKVAKFIYEHLIELKHNVTSLILDKLKKKLLGVV